MAIAFRDLKNNYPTEQLANRAKLFSQLGGEWPSKVNDPAYANTCAVRLSIALKKSGATLPVKDGIEGNGSPVIFKVQTMGTAMTRLFGPSTWGMSKQPGTAIKASDLPRFPGIVVYHVGWKDATGHFDLWTGNGFVGNGNFSDIADGMDIAVWRID
jgi:hypothetical protein